MTQPHIMLFDLYAGGHHGQYVRQLVEHWGTHRFRGRLTVTAPAAFFDRHGDVVDAAHAVQGVELVHISETVDTQGHLSSALAHGRLLKRYVETIKPSHAVCMYFDQVQLALALGLRFSYPVQLSGIYFRPTFHYEPSGPHKLRDRVVQLRKRLLLHSALRNPHFRALFCLDPFVVPHVDKGLAQVVALPDGAPVHPPLHDAESQRAQWGVAQGRRIALFFGSIAARKGIYQTLEALPLLSAAHQKQLSLVIAGRALTHDAVRVRDRIAQCRADTQVQIIHDERFADEEDLAGFFHAANLVLLPYQRHVGSSGVLIRAAQAGVPVLGPNYGLVGRYVQTHQLGITVDSVRPSAVAAGLSQWLRGSSMPFNKASALAFGRRNTAKQFCKTIMGALLPDIPPPTHV